MPFSHGKDGGVCVFVCFLRHRMFSHHPVGEGLAPPAWFRKAFILRGGFRPAGRPPLPAAAKEAKRRRGCPAVALRLQRIHPRAPVYGRYPYTFPQKVRRAKYGSGSRFFRATGPWCGAKFRPVTFYRRAWFRPAVAGGAGRGCVDWNCSENRKRADLGSAPTTI